VPPWEDWRARCAVSWALDRETIAAKVFAGLATASLSRFPPATAYYDPNTNPIGFDLTKAKELLAASSVPNGFTFELQVPSGNQPFLDIAQIWSDALSDIGVTVKVVQLDQTTVAQLRIEEKYSVEMGQWTNDTPDPDEISSIYLDYNNQHANRTSYNNPEVMAMVKAGREELDPVKRAQIYSDIQRSYNSDCPGIYSVALDRTFAAGRSVHGFQPNSQGKYLFLNVWKTP
jgi:peptide/nickel transport system substrate-binding protein